MNQLEEGKTYKTANGDTAEIFKIIDGMAYGRITFDREKNTWIAYQWRIDGTSSINSESANIIFDNPQPSWHQYVADGYVVLCRAADSNNLYSGQFVVEIDDNDKFPFKLDSGTSGFISWKYADPITTQCGKYITGMKDAKTVLLPIEYANPEIHKAEHKEPSPDLKVDDLVWVWDGDIGKKQIACFAQFDAAVILTWPYGQTSASNLKVLRRWQNWEKYQPE